MRLTVLGSSSAGNSTVLQSGDTTILIDCGFTAREMNKRMLEAGVDPTRLSAIVLTHEHADHIRGIPVMGRATKSPVFMSPLVRETFNFGPNKDDINFADPLFSSQPFEFGQFNVSPFA